MSKVHVFKRRRNRPIFGGVQELEEFSLLKLDALLMFGSWQKLIKIAALKNMFLCAAILMTEIGDFRQIVMNFSVKS